MKTYEEIVENSRKAISELKGPNGNTTYEGNPMIQELIAYQELLAEACGKQIAKKPDIQGNQAGVYETCPECNWLIIDSEEKPNYCKDCGQKLDWGKEE